jgi:hypothetical protein
MWLRLRVGGIRLPGQKAPPIPGAVPGDSEQQHLRKQRDERSAKGAKT